jgi:chloramphenicol-sensitive protein RarD
MRPGIISGIIAFFLWGSLPIFWKALEFLPPTSIIAQRTLWALLLILPLTLLRGRFRPVLETVRHPRQLAWLGIAAALLAANWLVYVWATLNEHIIEAALGYYLTPFLNMLLGRCFFGERHNRLQLAAITLAAGGVALRFIDVTGIPWVALTLAATFSVYGLARKKAPLGALGGLCGETILLAPFALAWLIFSQPSLPAAFGGSTNHALLVIAAGPATAIPLLCFGHAAKRLPLSTVGIIQFLAPTIQFLIGWQIYGEPLEAAGITSFSLIWLAVALYSLGSRKSPAP